MSATFGIAMFEKLSISERVNAAKDKTKRVVDHLLYLLELHENNAVILYSPILSAQIPTSYSANAFNVFQRGLHQFEIVRLCALWDSADPYKENIPSVIELIDLIDHSDVIEFLAEETASHWKNIGGTILTDQEGDPDLVVLTANALQRGNEDFGQEQAEKARQELRNAIEASRTIMSSTKYTSIMNLRDKHLAHSLSETYRERKVGPLPPMKYADERAVLNSTLPIVEALYCWINGTSFSFEDSRSIDRKNANALWTSCTFNIIR